MKTMSFMRCGVVAVALFVVLGMSERAQAIPILQIYLEGATYDQSTESWTLSPGGSSSGAPFKVWTIGNISEQQGGKGDISNVRLAISYDSDFGQLDIQLTPAKVSAQFQSDFKDANVPDAPEFLQYVDDVATGGVPQLTGGKDLPSHGEFVAGVAWQEWLLGDFTDETDAEITDFNQNFTDATDPVPGGQINVYEVTVLAQGGGSAHGVTLHFDLYDSVQSKNKGIFAPFSHDADGDANIIPTPAAPLIGGICFTLLGMMRPTRRRQD